MLEPRTRSAVILSLALAALGCASTGHAFEDGTSREVEVTVDNQNFKDAVVHAIWDGGARHRLGMVVGNTTETFATRIRGSGELRLQVDFIAGANVVSHGIGVDQGEEIEVVIPPWM